MSLWKRTVNSVIPRYSDLGDNPWLYVCNVIASIMSVIAIVIGLMGIMGGLSWVVSRIFS